MHWVDSIGALSGQYRCPGKTYTIKFNTKIIIVACRKVQLRVTA